MEAQRRFTKAADFYLKALALFAEFKDGQSMAKVLGSLARLRQARGDESLTGKIADVLGVSAEKAVKMLDAVAAKEEAEETAT